MYPKDFSKIKCAFYYYYFLEKKTPSHSQLKHNKNVPWRQVSQEMIIAAVEKVVHAVNLPVGALTTKQGFLILLSDNDDKMTYTFLPLIAIFGWVG